MKRFFVNHQLGDDFKLTDSEHHHLANVLRTRTGESVIVCCGDEFDYIYEAKNISKSATQMRFIEKQINKNNPACKLTVFMPLIKTEKLLLVTQKLNELGVSVMALFSAANSNVSQKEIPVDKLTTIAQQSNKQCGRSISLIIQTIGDFKNILEAVRRYSSIIFLDEKEQENRISKVVIPKEHHASNIAIILGPEGGFTEQERMFLRQIKNVLPVKLGRRILRAETAAIAAVSIIMAKLGEM